MQSRPPQIFPGNFRVFAFVLAAFVALIGIALVFGVRPAAALTAAQTQAKIDSISGSVADLKSGIAEDNRQIDALIARLSGLRSRASGLEAALASRQGELDGVTAKLERERNHLVEIKARLQRALRILEDQIVSLYMSGAPAIEEMVLASSSFGDLVSGAGYADAIQSSNETAVTRVGDLRDQIEALVARMKAQENRLRAVRDQIAAETVKAQRARDAVAARKAEFEASNASRQARIVLLQAKAARFENSRPELTSDPASNTAPAATPPVSGSVAVINADGTASPPADAPQAVKDVIAAGNEIIDLPYLWGGGHGSFELDSGYDCSGTLSYALNGGGLISSPLDSTGFNTWGEPGEGNWITVYGNPTHAFMYVAGIRLDTSDTGGTGPSWHSSLRDDTADFIATHPKGL